MSSVVVSFRRSRSVLKLSIELTLIVVVLLVATIFLVGAPTADGQTTGTCFWATATTGTFQWTNSANWSCSATPSTYPGQAAPDQAQISGTPTIQVTAPVPIPVSIVVNGFSGGPQIEADAGGTLPVSSLTSTSSGTTVLAANSGGTLDLTNATLGSFTGLTINGGRVVNSGTLTLNPGNTLLFHGGFLSGTGSTALAGGTVQFDGSQGPMTIDTQALQVNTTISVTSVSNPINLTNGALISLNNGATAPDGILFLTSDAPINGSGGSKIIAQPGTPPGSIEKAGGVTTDITAEVDNNGGVVVDNAGMTLNLLGGGTHTGTFLYRNAGALIGFNGTQVFNAGSNFSGPGDVSILGGTFQANTGLTIPGNLTNNGTLAFGPGPTTQGVAVSGNYTQSGSGALQVKLNGPTAGTGYDQVRVSGAATLSGALTATLGFAAPNNTPFDIITDATVAGDFASKALIGCCGDIIQEIPTPPSGTQVRLVALTPVDMAVVKTGPTSVVDGQNATFTIKVGNGNAAGVAGTNVVVTDTFSGGAFVSASATGGGICSGTTSPFTCTWPSIASASSEFVTVVLKAGTAPGPLTNTASVTANEFDPTPANNSSSVSVTINPASDVAIGNITGTPNPVNGGATATWSVPVSNAGPDTAPNTTVNISLSGGSIISTTASPGFSCTPTGPTSLSCSNTLFAVGNATISLTATAPTTAAAPWTLTANINSTASDPVPSNNTSAATIGVNVADLAVTKTGPINATPGSKVTFSITVTNNGPSDAIGVMLNDTSSRLAFNSASGACTAFPCSLGTMKAGQSANVIASYTVQPGTGAVSNTATVSSATPDSNSANNSSTVKISAGCPANTPSNQSPADGATNQPVTGILQWSDVGASSYNVFFGPAGNGCSTFFTTTNTNAARYADLQPGTTYEWRVEAVTPGCNTRSTGCIKFTTISGCPTAPPTLISPVNNTVTGPTTFTWSAVPGARDYVLVVNGNRLTVTTATSFGPVSVGNGPIVWSVTAELDPPCTSLTSTSGNYTSCDASAARTVASIIAQSDAGQTYTLSWDPVGGATRYEVDESTDQNFTSVKTLTSTGTTLNFQHTVTTPTPFFYRVRAFIGCANAFGPNSGVVRIVLAPVTAPANPNVSAQSGNTALIPVVVHINGFADGSFPFTATVDPQQSWLVSVEPSSGILPPGGINLVAKANPTGLSDGTHSGTVIVLVNTGSAKGGIVANGVTPVNAPVSISLVTPVTQKSSGPPPLNALIIPSTGHLDGLNSRWASDVRILNTSAQKVHYQITFTPDDLSKGVKQTVIETEAGATTALDDIVKTWYGVGSLGESSNGSLEIRPLDNPSKTGSEDTPSISFTTVASSRTYNAAPNSAAGTLGEFIPAIPFQNFVGKAAQSAAATVLSLQQIAQNDSMRTNFGVMEASGQPASVLVSVFDSSGKKLLDQTIALGAGQHAQLNGFLAQNHITLNDGRIETQVVSGEGKITAYASVIDNRSGDPILVSGVPLGQNSADHFVLPGVADLNTPTALWRTDMRIFNPMTSAQTAMLTFYPLNGQGQPQSTSMTINPGEVKQLDNTLGSLFGLSNTGGAIHVQTATAVPLVVSGRTYNLTSNGTFGQLTTAVTASDAIGKGDKPLQILQTESSVRQRTNVGIFEVTGKPATVEVTVFLPDSKFAPSTQIPLPANGFIQIPVIQSFGLNNVYNARVMMRVVGGDGRIGAYGSVIDQQTQDPTYVPAQQ